MRPFRPCQAPQEGLIRRCSFTHPPREGCYGCGRGPHLEPSRESATRHPPLGSATWQLATHSLRPRPGGSCHPSTEGFSHISPTSGPASRRPEGGVSPPLTGPGERPGTRTLCPPLPITSFGVCFGTPPPAGSIARERPGARERGPESGHISRSPLGGVPACRGSRRCPGRHVLGTALTARVRAVPRVPDDSVPPLGWGPPLLSGSPLYGIR